MKQSHMSKCCSESRKTRSNGEGKQRAKVEFSITVISSNIKIVLRGQDPGGIILVPSRSEELIGENGEFSSIKGVELPVTEWDNNIYEHDEASPHVEDGKPGRDQRAAMVS